MTEDVKGAGASRGNADARGAGDAGGAREPRSTKDRILDAAEVLLGERGPGETSLRDITAAAGVNLAAVNYHFQSKEALFRAVIERRVAPMQQRRIELLEAAVREAGDEQPDLTRIIEAFILPPLEMIGD